LGCAELGPHPLEPGLELLKSQVLDGHALMMLTIHFTGRKQALMEACLAPQHCKFQAVLLASGTSSPLSFLAGQRAACPSGDNLVLAHSPST
jgi:hypothetical protein